MAGFSQSDGGGTADARQRLGRAGERAAERFLTRRGYRVLARNYRCPLGEIDLVALHGRTIAFVEVKTRRGTVDSPLDAVDHRKQRRIVRAAAHYLAAHGLGERDARCDVVGVRPAGEGFACELVQDAFGLDDVGRW